VKLKSVKELEKDGELVNPRNSTIIREGCHSKLAV